MELASNIPNSDDTANDLPYTLPDVVFDLGEAFDCDFGSTAPESSSDLIVGDDIFTSFGRYAQADKHHKISSELELDIPYVVFPTITIPTSNIAVDADVDSTSELDVSHITTHLDVQEISHIHLMDTDVPDIEFPVQTGLALYGVQAPPSALVENERITIQTSGTGAPSTPISPSCSITLSPPFSNSIRALPGLSLHVTPARRSSFGSGFDNTPSTAASSISPITPGSNVLLSPWQERGEPFPLLFPGLAVKKPVFCVDEPVEITHCTPRLVLNDDVTVVSPSGDDDFDSWYPVSWLRSFSHPPD